MEFVNTDNQDRFIYNNCSIIEARKDGIDTRLRKWEWWITLYYNNTTTILSCNYQQMHGIYIELTLEKERRHFGAISGLAQINLRLGKFENALKNINEALKIHPFVGIKNIKPLLLEKLNKKEINFHLNYIN